MPLELENIQSGYNLSAINNNFQIIENTWDEKLDRLSSTQNNQMEQDLDMNSNRILNHPAPASSTDLVRLIDLQDFIGNGVVGVVPLIEPRQTGDGTTVLFNSPHNKPTLPGGIQVQIDGISQRPGTDYNLPTLNQIEFVEAPPIGSSIDITWFEPVVISS